MDAVLAGILVVPLDLTVEIGDREGVGKFYATVALDPPDAMSLGVASRFGPLQCRSNSNSSRCAATAAMTDFAATFPLSRVEAARIQRTITPRVHVPRLRLKAELDSDAVLAR
jgi:hypothetical protein